MRDITPTRQIRHAARQQPSRRQTQQEHLSEPAPRGTLDRRGYPLRVGAHTYTMHSRQLAQQGQTPLVNNGSRNNDPTKLSVQHPERRTLRRTS